MNILRNIIRTFTGDAEDQQPHVALALLGKHPGWQDHIPDIGLETDHLIRLKSDLYLTGIAGNIDRGSWAKLEASRGLAGFHHAFLFSLNDTWTVGRIWSSSDGTSSRRSHYPMIAAAQVAGVPFSEVGGEVLVRLAELEQQCRSTESAADVIMLADEARADLRRRIASMQPPEVDEVASAFDRIKAELDQQPVDDAFLRILYQIEREVPAACLRTASRGSRSGDATQPRAVSLRVPVCFPNDVEALLMWNEFCESQFTAALPRWILCPIGEGWVDLLLGPAGREQFFALKARPLEVPVSSDIPYQIDDEFRARFR
ncbi:MAG: hypothetical protein ACR2GY_11200 [Phycisphaerales bacterium]